MLLLVFFLSGLLALIYQVTWTRLLYPAFGMHLTAITAVIACFLGGMGLGSRWFGSLADRVNPWRLYALLEVLVGVWAVALPGLSTWIGEHLGRLGPVGVVPVLLVPCVLMGGTFPAFARGYWRQSRGRGRDLGTLYAVNTVGAAVGAALTGNVLLPAFGMDQIIMATAFGNLVLAAAVLGMRPLSEVTEPESPATKVAPGPRALLFVLFLTGFTSLSFELLWTRALTLVIGATTASYANTLAALLLGIALGSLLYRYLWPDRVDLNALAGVCGLLWFTSVVSFLGVGFLHPIHTWLKQTLPMAPLWLGLLAFLPTALMFGITFPLSLTLYTGNGSLGRRVGTAYAVNTLGSVVGVALTGLVLIDRLQSPGTLLVMLGLNSALFCLTLYISGRRGPTLLAAAGLGLALLMVYPRGLFFENQWRVLQHTLPPPLKILLQAEDATSMATVVEIEQSLFQRVAPNGDLVSGPNRDIFHSNWRGVGGTGIYLWNLTGAYLAGLWRPPGRVLLIGLGSGRLMSTLLGLEGVERIDVVEINRINLEASKYFYLDPKRMPDDPRVDVRITDGRNFLLRTQQKYDLIVVDVGGLAGDGSEFLYTRDFVELCRQHLSPKGRLMTWIDLPRLLSTLGARYLRSFSDVFPEVGVCFGSRERSNYGYMWIVGSLEPISLDMPALEARWSRLRPDQLAELKLAGFAGPEDLASLFLMGLGGTRPDWLSQFAPMTDLRPYYPGSTPPPALPAELLFETGWRPTLIGATEAQAQLAWSRRDAFLEAVKHGFKP